ncbi:nuclear transport factor 2 family protein [Actinoplanes bogorensis]|uniref:Nuclear transport factor 2 family protein n=1 Tax=Paractinoplanes bogorensis TaxID=1610840 RepID=A0ABS5YL78_9ACTN|nr:nuclear transport factor 2 family protein [Actinoplanes bogorensis]MBU2663801.1 nuclear transport factor 2 family protein [Actinoplanes bogorensis]
MSFVEVGAAAIAAGIDDMYAAFLAGDRSRFDAHLHEDVTTWETHLPGPLRTRRELDQFRDTRDAAGERPVLDVMTAVEKRIDVWGDTGVARYVLVTRDAGSGLEQRTRVTDVLRCLDGSWRIVHHHAELVRP